MKATQTDIKVFDSLPAGWFSKSDVKIRGFESRMKRMITLKMVEQNGEKFKILPVDMICDGCWTTGLQSDLAEGGATGWGGTKMVCQHCGHGTFYRLENAELKAGAGS